MNKPEKFHTVQRFFRLSQHEAQRFSSKDDLLKFINKSMAENTSNIKIRVAQPSDPGDPEGGYFFLMVNWTETVENKNYDEEMKKYTEFLEKELAEIRKK